MYPKGTAASHLRATTGTEAAPLNNLAGPLSIGQVQPVVRPVALQFRGVIRRWLSVPMEGGPLANVLAWTRPMTVAPSALPKRR